MVVHITLQDIQELNQIRTLITSEDLENQKLGINLLKTHRLLTGDFRGMLFHTNSGKDIPIDWFFRKIDETMLLDAQNVQGYTRFYPNSLINIIDALVKGEPKFSTKIRFSFDHIYNEDDRRVRQAKAVANPCIDNGTIESF